MRVKRKITKKKIKIVNIQENLYKRLILIKKIINFYEK